ncbi:MAG TPA: DUF6036 family nucleotidyltransferase [Ktedonobacteraceae bacterium]
MFDWDEVNRLITLLNAQGISYLIGSDEPLSMGEESVDPVQLIQRLAASGYPLVENASISLFILHPELVPFIVTALQRSEHEIAENIAIVTLATLYMQQWWIFRLTFALGCLPSFPEAPFVSLWEERHLPVPSAGYGRPGLQALQEYQRQRYGIPIINFLDDWQNQINHLLAQETAYHRKLRNEVREELRGLGLKEQKNMSMRQSVGKQQIEQFLIQVGRTRQSGRLYLTGGAALVHRGIRPGQTLDIDIHVTVDPANLTVQIAQLKQKLNINIEFASPGDFIPLPTQWEARSQFISRYDQVDVFYFDWYSIALSKMQRANRQDIIDTQLLTHQRFIDIAELDLLCQDVLNKIGNPPYDRLLPNLSPQQFSLNYQAVRGLL